MRKIFIRVSILVLVSLGFFSWFWPMTAYAFLVVVPIIFVGICDMTQTRHSIRRNFPVIGHFRYLLESIRPEIQQYFIELNDAGMPFSREHRSVIYQRAKKELDTVPFGTQLDVYRAGYEWINHSIVPKHKPNVVPRVLLGGTTCKQPYSASLLNISAMSFGALSKNAIMALNKGAKIGGFAHNTGEGGISPFHLEHGGDLIWQIGTGYFGCRTKDGNFDLEKFKENAARPSVKVIELKLSQGAKPGHGGILPGKKVTPLIAQIRGVEMGKDVISPPAHTAFSTPIELLEFLTKLREASGGKPVGFKLCVGKRREFFAICKAMIKTGLHPDYISIDGAEGGTGAAPLEFSNSLGTPLREGLIFVHNALVGTRLRSKIKIAAAGKIATGFSMAQTIALGADYCYSARAMMFAVGCIQALRCNNNTCPAGVASQDPELVAGLHVEDKAPRVAQFHAATLDSFLEVISAAGLTHPSQLRPWHIQRRVSISEVKHYAEIYPYIQDGDLLERRVPDFYSHAWDHATAETF